MTTFIKVGFGFNVGPDFARAKVDTPIELSPTEYAQPGYAVGYIAGNPSHSLGFMRPKRIRVHVQIAALGGIDGSVA